MRSANGFRFPMDCDLDIEFKITATPKIPNPTIK
jgi:hypothetical protein